MRSIGRSSQRQLLWIGRDPGSWCAILCQGLLDTRTDFFDIQSFVIFMWAEFLTRNTRADITRVNVLTGQPYYRELSLATTVTSLLCVICATFNLVTSHGIFVSQDSARVVSSLCVINDLDADMVGVIARILIQGVQSKHRIPYSGGDLQPTSSLDNLDDSSNNSQRVHLGLERYHRSRK